MGTQGGAALRGGGVRSREIGLQPEGMDTHWHLNFAEM
jgi:hypothetical protein